MKNIFIMIIAGIPLYMFVAWRFVAAYQSYQEGIKGKKNSPLPYLLSKAVTYTVLPFILIFLIKPYSLFMICFFAALLSLGLWHFYWWYKFKIFLKRKLKNNVAAEN